VFKVSSDDYNFMLPEIEKYFQTDIEISLKIFKLQGKKSDF
jgi:hypothetical protein